MVTVILFGLVLFTGGIATGKPVGIGQFLLIVSALVMFYPLLLYLSESLRVAPAFWLSYLAVSGLVLWNLRRGQGLRFALRYGGFALVVLLGLSTAAVLATEGSGVIVTVGLLLMVGYVMSIAPAVAQAVEESRPQLPPAPPPPARQPSPPVDADEGGSDADRSDEGGAEACAPEADE
jgi:hypothetical protein